MPAIFGAKIPFTSVHVPAFREPQHGDIVVFRHQGATYIKRVLATEGETVEIREIPDYEYRYVYVNGQPVLVEPESRRIVYVMR